MSSSFTGNLQIEQLGLTENVLVLKDLSYYSLKYQLVVVMRKGFITDLDSIPSCLKSYVRASPKRSWRAYALHDALYRSGYDLKIADDILDDALEIVNIGWYPRHKVSFGLRLFGSATDNEELIVNAHQYVEIHDCDVYDISELPTIAEQCIQNQVVTALRLFKGDNISLTQAIV
jgi:hypothetical protein